jgi:phospholipase/carboxylesterase
MAKPVYVFLHGYGSNEDDLPGLVEYLPKLAFVSPRAPLTLQTGSYAWAPITVPGNPAAEPVEAATEDLWGWIDANVPSGALIIPIGFSQGGMMATQLLRTRPERVLATIVLSGFTLGHPQPADEALLAELPPLIYCYGLDDSVISSEAVTRTTDWVKTHTTATVRSYYRLGHSVDGRVMDDVAEFLGKVL